MLMIVIEYRPSALMEKLQVGLVGAFQSCQVGTERDYLPGASGSFRLRTPWRINGSSEYREVW